MSGIDIAVITRERRQDVVMVVRSILADLGPDDTIHVLENGCPEHSTAGLDELFPTVHWHRSEENLGVPGGRNRLLELTAAPIVAFVDDDATLEQGSLDHVRAAFAGDPRLAVVAFRIDDPVTGEPRSHEYPFPGTDDIDVERPASYFVGAGYALHRRAVEDVGVHDGRFFYALEELDYSFGLIAAGWMIRYVPGARVVHRASPEGRPTGQKVYYMVRHRLVVGRRWLPWRYRLSHLAVWLPIWLWRAIRARQQRHYWRGIRDGIRMCRDTERTPLAGAALEYLRRNGGRLRY